MRKVILGVAITLDGFIEGPNGEYDWCLTDQDYGMGSFIKRIDAVFYGRKTFDVAKAEEQKSGYNPFASIPAYVFSTTLKTAGTAKIVSGNLRDEVTKIKSLQGKDIWLFGGADLTRSMIREDLLDEISLAIHPILLGSGKRLFDGIGKKIKLELIGTKKYDTGLVSATYRLTTSKPSHS